MKISRFIDYAVQKDTISKSDIIELCNNAKHNNFYSVCIPSLYVTLAKQLLSGSTIKICAIIGYPYGEDSTIFKVTEAKAAIKNGADEIDLVINLNFLKSKNYIAVLKDICDVMLVIDDAILKVSIEISELSKNEIIKTCEICLDAKVDYIKTSSQFNKNSTTLTAVKIIKKTVRDHIKIKASGDINNYEIALKYLDAGAERIGTSSILKMNDQTRQIKNSKIYKQYLQTQNKTNTTSVLSIEHQSIFSK